MKKIICIGECSLNVILDSEGRPLGTMPGGRIANAAAMLARDKFEVIMASEASADPVGDIVVNFLANAGVDTKSVDRFTEGRTALNVFVAPGSDSDNAMPSLTRYESYPDEAFDTSAPNRARRYRTLRRFLCTRQAHAPTHVETARTCRRARGRNGLPTRIPAPAGASASHV